jgi:mannosyltransferase OCH1-like enzyme
MIPKIIWQTYEQSFDQLPGYLIDMINTWKVKNPEYEYRYASSDDRNKFVLDNFGQHWLDLFLGCPVPVMRADIWRYMVLYKVGGVYTDIDTVCNDPVNTWIDSKKDFIIAIENDFNFASWTMASAPNNPALLHLINNIKNKLESITDYSKEPYYVHMTTGPAIWTESIISYFDYQAVPGTMLDQLDNLNRYPSLIENKVLVLDEKKLCGDAVFHVNASQFWINKDDYRSWVNDVDYKMEWQN